MERRQGLHTYTGWLHDNISTRLSGAATFILSGFHRVRGTNDKTSGHYKDFTVSRKSRTSTNLSPPSRFDLFSKSYGYRINFLKYWDKIATSRRKMHAAPCHLFPSSNIFWFGKINRVIMYDIVEES